MPITAVVLDIGGVLEINDDALFPGPWCERHGFTRDRLGAAFAFPRDPMTGGMTQTEMRERGLTVGILSNSGPGAREQEACWGFQALVDVLVYSHEVGLKKPDPAIYALTAELLGVPPDEIVFLDNWLPAVEGARAAGWHAVHHTDTDTSIRALEELLAR